MSLLLLLGCLLGDDSAPHAEDAALSWYLGCGDPVCQGYTGPFEGVPACTTEAPGVACAEEGATCDPVDECNARLQCATSDPTQQEGGCPISLASAKREIRYLTDAERADVAKDLLTLPLATWSYRWEPAGAPPHLGFIIDDVGAGPAVTADGGHVDLYGYTSLAVAALQAQEQRLAAQEAELAALRAEVAAMRATLEVR